MNADDREYVRRLGRVAGGSAVCGRTTPADAPKGDVRAALELLATGEPAGAGTKPMPYKEWVRAIARNALSAPHQGETGEGWRPIETAPKESTPILLYCVHVAGEQIAVCWWAHGQWQGGPAYVPQFKPLAWRPLPDPPATPSEGQP